MRIESIELTNYGPFYGTHTFAFSDRGLVLIMGDNQDEPRMNSNGAGKSSIFDALDWCLFGRVPRGDHADSTLNDESRELSVRVNLTSDSGESAYVVRTRGNKKASPLTFVEGTVDKTTLDTKETQRLIELFLGLDRDVFHAAVLFGQTDLVHYAESTDAERMEILTKILQLDEIDTLLEKVKALVAINDGTAARITADIQANLAVLSNLKRVDFAGQIKAWKENQAAELIKLQNMKAASERDLGIPQADVQALPGMRAQLVALEAGYNGLVSPNPSGVNDLIAQFNRVDREHEKALTQLNQLQQQAVQHRQVLGQAQQICMSCGQVVSRSHIEDKLKTVEQAIVVQAESVTKLQADKDRLHTEVNIKRAEFDTLQLEFVARRNEGTRSTTELRGKIRAAELQEVQLQKALATIKSIDGLIATKAAEENPFIVQQQSNLKSVKDTEGYIAALESELAKVSLEHQYLNFWLTGLGVRGLKSYILDSRLQELTDAANQWVKILTGGTIWVQFESQKQTRGNKVINSPDVRVCRWNPDGTITERNFKSWSGGEKQRISFAIDFGLSRLIASRAKQRYDLLILDEVFRHLDRSGKEAVMEMLQMLSAEKSSVLVVEHDTEFQDAFEHRVIVRKTNRRSTILEVDNGKKNKQAPRQTGSANDEATTSASVVRADNVKHAVIRQPVTGFAR